MLDHCRMLHNQEKAHMSVDYGKDIWEFINLFQNNLQQIYSLG